MQLLFLTFLRIRAMSILLNWTFCVPGSRCDISLDLLNKLKSFNILSDCCHGHELHSHPANKPAKVGRSRLRWRKRGKRGSKQRIRTIITPSRPTIKSSEIVNRENLVHIRCGVKRNLDIRVWNARSMCNKTLTINDFILSLTLMLIYLS